MTAFINSILISSLLSFIHITLVMCLLRKITVNQLSPMAIHVFTGLFCLVLLGILCAAPINFDVWLSFTLFVFVSTIYLFLFSAIYKSLSLRFLLLMRSRDNKASITELDAMVTQASFVDRTELLCKMDLARKDGEVYIISQKGARVAMRIERFRKFFGIETKGLYQENGAK